MDPIITLLELAESAVRDAADMLSDINCDRWADAGGIGRPPTDRRIERLYQLAETLADIEGELL